MYAHDAAVIATPIGTVYVTGTDHRLTSIRIEAGIAPERDGETAPVRAAVRQVREYFDGMRTTFDLPLEPLASSCGMALRAAMCAVGYGETAPYGVVAASIGSSARAVGGACRRNPFPIVVPCHRVTSATGPEHYSAGDGAQTKAWLIAHEHRIRSMT